MPTDRQLAERVMALDPKAQEYLDVPAPCEFTLPIKPERIDWLLVMIGWSPGELAKRLNVRDDVVRHWRSGKSFMPFRAAVWMETVAAVVLALPQPAGWGDKTGVGAERHGASQIETAWSPPQKKPAAKLTPANPFGDDSR